MQGGSGSFRADPRRFAFTTSKSANPIRGRWLLMGCMTWEETPAGSAWVWTTHGSLCGREHSPLVALDGHSQLSASDTPLDHGRFRRQQRLAGEAVEVGVAETGRRNRAGGFGQSFSAGHEQVEKDPTPAVLLHQSELAGQNAHPP